MQIRRSLGIEERGMACSSWADDPDFHHRLLLVMHTFLLVYESCLLRESKVNFDSPRF